MVEKYKDLFENLVILMINKFNYSHSMVAGGLLEIS